MKDFKNVFRRVDNFHFNRNIESIESFVQLPLTTDENRAPHEMRKIIWSSSVNKQTFAITQ